MTAPVLILPRTPAGRELLRLILRLTTPAGRGPNGLLPDGSSIYGTDFDEAAIEADRISAEYEAWCRANGRKDY